MRTNKKFINLLPSRFYQWERSGIGAKKPAAGAIDIKILILGSSGVVGFHLAELLSKKHEVVRAARSSASADVRADLSTEAGVASALGCKPDAVINAVKPALSVDEMEVQRQEAYSLNTLLPERLAKHQKKSGFRLIHISTDGIYPGGEGKIYDEEALAYPPNYYCYTKALAEERIRVIAKDYLILRTEGVFGYDEKGTNFFMRMANAAKRGAAFSAASDYFSQPICGMELARLADALITKEKFGIYNACGAECVSRHWLACKIKAQMGWEGLEIKKSSIKDRKIPVQGYLLADVSKIGKEAG